MKRTLIIGGCGFIGSHLVDRCLLAGAQAAVYDNLSVGTRERLPDAAAANLNVGDILDTEILGDVMKAWEPDVIYHLAAIHHIPTCEQNPKLALRVNVEGTQSVIEARARCAPEAKLVLASTGAIYDVTTAPLRESSAIAPVDVYGIGKRCCEDLLARATRIAAGQAIVARLFNTVGARETNPHLVPDILKQLAAGASSIRLGNLSPKRDYIHVQDVAEALHALGETDSGPGLSVYNVGSGIEHSVEEVARTCVEIAGSNATVVSDPDRCRRVDRPNQLADIGKLRQHAGWAPRRTLREALADAWKETGL